LIPLSVTALEHKRRAVTSGRKKLFFDTHTLWIIYDNKDVTYKDVITEMQQMALQKMSGIAPLKKDMIILENSKFLAHKSENEKK
ncbi:hypothetical protein E2I00_019129, partial [Balaenoptera physalus]